MRVEQKMNHLHLLKKAHLQVCQALSQLDSELVLHFDLPQLSFPILSVLFGLGSGLMEDQEEPTEPQNGSSSSTHDPEEPVGEKKDKPPEEADRAQEKQQEVSHSPTQNKEEMVTEEIQADLEVNKPQSENTQEEEDKVDTFFSTMSHRYEAPPLL